MLCSVFCGRGKLTKKRGVSMGVDNRDWHRQWWRDKLEREERAEGQKPARVVVFTIPKFRRGLPFVAKLGIAFAVFVLALALLRLYLRG